MFTMTGLGSFVGGRDVASGEVCGRCTSSLLTLRNSGKIGPLHHQNQVNFEELKAT